MGLKHFVTGLKPQCILSQEGLRGAFQQTLASWGVSFFAKRGFSERNSSSSSLVVVFWLNKTCCTPMESKTKHGDVGRFPLSLDVLFYAKCQNILKIRNSSSSLRDKGNITHSQHGTPFSASGVRTPLEDKRCSWLKLN